MKTTVMGEEQIACIKKHSQIQGGSTATAINECRRRT